MFQLTGDGGVVVLPEEADGGEGVLAELLKALEHACETREIENNANLNPVKKTGNKFASIVFSSTHGDVNKQQLC